MDENSYGTLGVLIFFSISGYLISASWESDRHVARFALKRAVLPHNAEIGLALIAPALTIWIATRSWPVVRAAARFGDLSYGIYVYAWPVQQIYVHFLGKDTSYVALVVPSLATTIALAGLSWRCVEAPSLRSKDSLAARPPRSRSFRGALVDGRFRFP